MKHSVPKNMSEIASSMIFHHDKVTGPPVICWSPTGPSRHVALVSGLAATTSSGGYSLQAWCSHRAGEPKVSSPFCFVCSHNRLSKSDPLGHIFSAWRLGTASGWPWMALAGEPGLISDKSSKILLFNVLQIQLKTQWTDIVFCPKIVWRLVKHLKQQMCSFIPQKRFLVPQLINDSKSLVEISPGTSLIWRALWWTNASAKCVHRTARRTPWFV